MRMQKTFSAAHAGKGHGETNYSAAVERAENLTARVVRHHEDCRGHRNMLAPDKELQLHALLILGKRFAMADFHLARRSRRMFCRRIHRVFATFVIARFDGFAPSAALEESHSSSLRPRGRSAKRRPSSTAAASMCWKRCLILRFAFLSA